ncbi:hypothetical protein OCU04_005870 [Sclerotinia nivalis]|uniref:Uncharacterized protein n=1 Tax=Sclerotinia nivalis TaxID=352851 RepID=A0A9X0ALU3_9HELO|nr:hypothetical protein OCU04_005870 [Sclerotinia nivalis]
MIHVKRNVSSSIPKRTSISQMNLHYAKGFDTISHYQNIPLRHKDHQLAVSSKVTAYFCKIPGILTPNVGSCRKRRRAGNEGFLSNMRDFSLLESEGEDKKFYHLYLLSKLMAWSLLEKKPKSSDKCHIVRVFKWINFRCQ